MTTFATIHEHKMLSTRLARVTASIHGTTDKDVAAQAMFSSLKELATPVKDSFRWLDDARTQCVGYVYAIKAVRELPKNGDNFRVMAANLFMDEKDKSLWDVKEGAAGKYIARQGCDDLSAMIEKSRVSPKGSTVRMSAIASAQADKHELVAFVSENRNGAEMDYGICLGHGIDGAIHVLSMFLDAPIVVKKSHVVSAHVLNLKSLPAIPRKVAASKYPELAATAMDPQLTPEQYWKLAYSYNSEYLAKVLQQVAEMSAL